MSDYDPAKEWQRLSELYLSKYDDELLALADTMHDLTPTAQEVLTAELKRRGLTVESSKRTPPDEEEEQEDFASRGAAGDMIPSIPFDPHTRGFGGIFKAREDFEQPRAGEYLEWIPTEQDNQQAAAEDRYVAKVLLREFATPEEARAARYLLEQAGIESWVLVPTPAKPHVKTPGILVAEDQLSEASTVLPDVLPGDLVQEMGQTVEDFLVPVCPKCGASDPLLEMPPEGELSNLWSCEACGNSWKESLS